MATKRAVQDPKVRRTLGLVGAVFLLVVALAVQNHMARVTEQERLEAPVAATDDRLVVMDGDTMIIEPEALGQTMRAWLESPKGKSFIFELSDRSFQPNSAAPAPITVTRTRQVIGLVKSHPALRIHIVQPGHFARPAERKLDEQRAIRLRKDLVASGVAESRVTLERAGEGSRPATGEQMYVLLTK